jgi:hypothetical protein
MTRAIEHIVAGYSTLKNRNALEEIRDHRRRLLIENRMRAASSGFNLDRITTELEEEISIVETALSRFQDQASSQPD